MKYKQVNLYFYSFTSSDFLPWKSLLLWVTVMICEASGGILTNLVI